MGGRIWRTRPSTQWIWTRGRWWRSPYRVRIWDTSTLDQTLIEAGVADLVEREAELRAEEKPKVNVEGIEELAADKGYHSGPVVERLKTTYKVRSYIPEKQQKRTASLARQG